jgi:hypothetical protein
MPEPAKAIAARMIKSELAPFIRSFGFKGSGGDFRLAGDRGDVAFVNVQGSRWNTADRYDFFLNVAVLPLPWWQWKISDWPKEPKPNYSFGLYRTRIGDGLNGWSVWSEDSAVSVADQLSGHLADSQGLPLLEALLDRHRMIDQIRQGDLGDIVLADSGWAEYFDIALAVLLADKDQGSDEFQAVLSRIDNRATSSDRADLYNRLERWVRTHAASR